jgi:polyisoprenoid-binding protein YceI
MNEMRFFTIAIIGAALFAAACEDPSANRPQAVTSAPNANSAATAIKGDALPLTPDNSKIEFTGSKVTGKHDGGFRQVSGTIDWVDGKPETSSVSISIDMLSVFTDNEDLTEHLKSPDFFDVARFPNASFVSTRIEPDPSKGANSFTVTGDFDLHGVRKSISFPATIAVTDDAVTVNSDFSINRKDFEIVYAGVPDDLIRDGVAIRLDLKAPRKN